MDQFEDIFTPPESPGQGIGTTTIRRPTRNSIDEKTMQKVRTQLFMNQLNDAETGNVDTPGQAGATGGFNEPVLPPQIKQEPNVNIVNEYNSFNLANVTPPVPPKWKTSDTLLDDFCKFRRSCQHLMALCVTFLLVRSRHPCYLLGQVWMVKTSMKISIYQCIKGMT